MALPFKDRGDAGRQLGAALLEKDLHHPLILGVPRGGVPVAAEVARALQAELDVVVVRKIGAPDNSELGLGAVGAWGEPWLDPRLLDALSVPEAYLQAETERQRDEARRRLTRYRGDAPRPALSGRDTVVVDDGIATGGTAVAAAALLRTEGPRRVLLAIPVAPKESVGRLQAAFDEVVLLYVPEPYFAVGQWYGNFAQTSDDEVRALLGRTSTSGG